MNLCNCRFTQLWIYTTLNLPTCGSTQLFFFLTYLLIVGSIAELINALFYYHLYFQSEKALSNVSMFVHSSDLTMSKNERQKISATFISLNRHVIIIMCHTNKHRRSFTISYNYKIIRVSAQVCDPTQLWLDTIKQYYLEGYSLVQIHSPPCEAPAQPPLSSASNQHPVTVSRLS